MIVEPAVAVDGPLFTIERSGVPAFATGFVICNVPSEGVPPSARDEPVKRCAPAPRRALNWTNPSLVLVKLTVNVYVQTSAPARLERVGPDVIVTLEEGVNPLRFSIPMKVLPPCVFVWSKSTAIT